MGDAANEHNLGSIAASGLLGSNVDLHIAADGRDALKGEVVLKTSKLKKVVERGAHAATKGVLLESLALREGVVGGVLGTLGDENSDSADSEQRMKRDGVRK